MELWSGTGTASKLLRNHSRQFNNAVCLSSVEVKEPRFYGFTPNVTFQGRLTHRVGALQHNDGDTPRFAQLYVLDPSLQKSQRFNNMTIPGNITDQVKKQMKELLYTIQETLHTVNPYIKDFKQVIQIPEEEIGNGKIVITAMNKKKLSK